MQNIDRALPFSYLFLFSRYLIFDQGMRRPTFKHFLRHLQSWHAGGYCTIPRVHGDVYGKL